MPTFQLRSSDKIQSPKKIVQTKRSKFGKKIEENGVGIIGRKGVDGLHKILHEILLQKNEKYTLLLNDRCSKSGHKSPCQLSIAAE
jgi:hypothetical protein